MTFMSRPYLKLFSSFLLIATILLFAGCLGTPSKGVSRKSDGDTNRPVSGKNVQSMFYKAQHQETGNMWDVWLHHHEDTYFLYYLANITQSLALGQYFHGYVA